MRSIKRFFFILFLSAGILSSADSFSQNSSSSPYSRYGMGDLLFSGFAKNLGMGGIGQAISSPLNLNSFNPAAYSALWLTTYEAGVNLGYSEQQGNSLSQKNKTASLAYFAFGFPVKTRKWGMGFGLLPYSNVGYKVEESRQNEFNVPESRYYEGSGGLNQFYLTNGFSLAKKLSAGVTASYLFGVINQDRRVEFDDVSYFNTNISNSNSLGWFHFNLGLQYSFDSLRIAPSDSIRSIDEQIKTNRDSIKTIVHTMNDVSDASERAALMNKRALLDSAIVALKESKKTVQIKCAKSDWDLGIGFIIAPGADLRGRQSVLAYNFKYLNNSTKDQVLIRDTIANTDGDKGNIHLPLSASLGFSMKKGNKWLFGADFSIQQWSDFTYFGQADSLVDSWKVAVGGQYTPNERAIKAYWKQVQYRIGYHYSKSFLDLKGVQLEEMGASLGFGFPIRRAGTTVHFTTEAGKRGSLKNDLVQEKYLRFTIGFTLNDRWFIKPKYD